MFMGSYARRAYGIMGGGQRHVDRAREAGDALVTGATAFLTGFLSAKSNINGDKGKFLKVPIPALTALVLGGVGLSGYGGGANHVLLTAAKSALAVQLGFMGVKAGYAPTGQPATIAALPYPGYAGQLGVPRVGATPNVEQLFQSVGLTARR